MWSTNLFNEKMLVPILLILFSSAVKFGTCCCEKKEKISSYLDVAVDLILKVKSENVSCQEEHELQNWKPLDCTDLYRKGYNKSGVYAIWPVSRLTLAKRLDVFCDMDNGGWTVIQRRGNFGRADDFFDQDWTTYKKGFGDLESDFWLGNDNIFAITNQRLYSVYFSLEDQQRNKVYAQYDNFWIDDEFNKYALHISGYRGTAGDAMRNHNNQKFSTKDRKNDNWKDGNCGKERRSGWWFDKCIINGANLNGLYNPKDIGITWTTWKPNYGYFPRAEIKIKSSTY